MDEVKFLDGTVTVFAADTIAINVVVQMDTQRNTLAMMKDISEHKTDGLKHRFVWQTCPRMQNDCICDT